MVVVDIDVRRVVVEEGGSGKRDGLRKSGGASAETGNDALEAEEFWRVDGVMVGTGVLTGGASTGLDRKSVMMGRFRNSTTRKDMTVH